MEKTFSEKTSAADKSIGFDYQYYYFLDTVLNLKLGQRAGLEVKDDVHTELDADRQILIQLKHTTQTNINGDPKSLTTLDIDLWKTLSNWAQVISDVADGREKFPDQLKFLVKTKFLLVSNKSRFKNEFIETLEKYAENLITDDAIVQKLLEIQLKTENINIKEYIQNIIKLNRAVIYRFMKNIEFELNENELITRIKNSIASKIISSNRVDRVYGALDSALRTDNFFAAKAGVPIIVSYDDFIIKYGKFFSDTRSDKLIRHNFTHSLPKNLQEQTFVRQLLEIEDFKADDIDRIIRYTTCKILLSEHLERWKIEGLLTDNDIANLHSASQTEWDNRFLSAYRSIHDLDTPTKKNKALAIIDELRKLIAEVDGQRIDINLSNGEYYYLSDLPAIGWHHEWEKKFK